MRLPPGVTTIYGAPGTRKSTMLSEWEGPVKVFDFELGMHRAWGGKKRMEAGELLIYPCPLPVTSLTKTNKRVTGMSELYNQFSKEFTEAVESPDIATIGIDTGTMDWKMVCDAFLQELQGTNPNRVQLIQIEYGVPNNRMTMQFNAARVNNKHLVLTFHETDQYVPVMFNGKPMLDTDGNPKMMVSGKKIPDGFRHAIALSDWVLRCEIREVADKNNGVTLTPVTTIQKSPLGLDLVGVEIEWFTYGKFCDILEANGRI